MMSIRIDNGLVVGNTFDKYGTNNPLAKKLMRGFLQSVQSLATNTDARTIHEVGCGEGKLSKFLSDLGFTVRGTDVSGDVLGDAIASYPDIAFEQKSIYDLSPTEDTADMIVCCEVFEHLDNPQLALESIANIAKNHLLVSVPREPIWRILNVMRGKYIRNRGNTPGHLNHWSTNSFVRFLEQRFNVIRILKPLPWTMVLCSQKETAR